MFEKLMKKIMESKRISEDNKKKIKERIDRVRETMGQQKDLNNP